MSQLPANPTAVPARRSTILRLFIWALRLTLATVFVWAAFPKIIHPGGFGDAIHAYRLLPPRLDNLAAIVMPWVELLAAAALLLVPRFRDAAAAIMAALLVIFIVAISIVLAQGRTLSCGCFDVTGEKDVIGPWKLVQDGLWLLAAIALLLHSLLRLEPKTPR